MADRRDPRVVYQEVVSGGHRPSVGIVLAALKACKASRDLKTGKDIHSDVMERYKELSTHRFVSSSLVDLYARCGCLGDARKVFESMTAHDLVSWNCMIQGYAQNGQPSSALELYDRMLREGFAPNRVTVLAALKACVSLAEKEEYSKVDGRRVKVKSLERGRDVHLRAGHEHLDPFVANTLMDMYANCGSMEDARTVFERMKKHDLVSWNCIILGYAQNGQGELALKLYSRMQEEGCLPNTVTFLGALKACGSLCEKEQTEMKVNCLELARSIHMQASERPEGPELFVSNALIDVYSKCGSMPEAYKAFKAMQRRDVVSWNSIIQGYAQSGDGDVALRLFEEMRGPGVCQPDRVTILAALKACAALTDVGDTTKESFMKLKSLEKAKAVHAQASKSGYDKDVFVASTLVDLYGKCGSVQEARKVFDRIQQRGVVLWTSMLMAYAHNSDGEVALELYKRMQDEGCVPNKVTVLAVLKACASLAENEQESLVNGNLVKASSLERGRAIHLQASEAGFAADLFIGNTLVDMYAKCWSMSEASEVFESMEVHDTVSWNCIIQGYAYRGEAEATLELFTRMVDEGDFRPNRVTVLAALKACATLAEKEEGKLVDGKKVKEEALKKTRSVHSQATGKLAGHGDEELETHVANSLIDVYGKCASMTDARSVFDRLRQRTTVSWSAVIMGYAENGEGEVALELYEGMQSEGFSVSEVTVLAALKACVNLAEQTEGAQGDVEKARWLEKGRALHEQAAQLGDELDVFVANTLIDMYAKCGSLVEARRVFDTVGPERRSAVTWNCLIQAYAQNDQGELALELYFLMQASFPADKVTFLAGLKACAALGEKEAQGSKKQLVWLNKGREIHDQALVTGDLQVANSLVDMYSKCGSLEDARRVFEGMKKRSVVSWNCIILAHAEGGEGKMAMEFYSRMKEQGACEPDMVTYVAALKACASLAALEAGRRIRDELSSRSLQRELMVANSLLNFFAKCGSMDEAEEVFRSVHDKSLVSWSALIAGYSLQGDTDRVIELFERMKSADVRPNEVTFLSVLNACSHSGMVERGQEYFQAMVGHGVTPGIQHYTCMVDLLGRANRVEQALAMVESMPFDPDVVVWTALLGAARKWKNLRVGELAFRKAVELDSQNSAVYSLMSSIYASLNMWKEAGKIQEMRKSLERGRNWNFEGSEMNFLLNN